MRARIFPTALLKLLERNITVPDLGSRIHDVVLVRCMLVRESPRGSGFWNGEGMKGGWKWEDQFTSNLGTRWTGSYHTKEGFQVSKREWERSKGELERGSKKQGECAISVCQPVYMYILFA
jgi:hypothetical protein